MSTSPAPPDFTSPDILLQHLSSAYRPLRSLAPLSGPGGGANFVFRGQLADKQGTVIVKHSAPYIASMPDVALDPIRSVFEAEILTLLAATPLGRYQPGLGGTITVRTPGVLFRDSKNSITVFEDAGESAGTLKALMSAGSLTVPARELGATLGAWLSAFHGWSAAHLGRFAQHDMARRVVPWYYYGRLAETVSAIPSLSAHVPLCEKVAEQVPSALEDETVIHGDFWTGNVLLGAGGKEVTVLDWEVCRAGPRWWDVAQMCAELMLLVWVKGAGDARDVARAMLEAYDGIGEEAGRSAAVHVAVHTIIIGGTIEGWGDKEDVMRRGVEVLKKAWDGGWGIKDVVEMP